MVKTMRVVTVPLKEGMVGRPAEVEHNDGDLFAVFFADGSQKDAKSATLLRNYRKENGSRITTADLKGLVINHDDAQNEEENIVTNENTAVSDEIQNDAVLATDVVSDAQPADAEQALTANRVKEDDSDFVAAPFELIETVATTTSKVVDASTFRFNYVNAEGKPFVFELTTDSSNTNGIKPTKRGCRVLADVTTGEGEEEKIEQKQLVRCTSMKQAFAVLGITDELDVKNAKKTLHRIKTGKPLTATAEVVDDANAVAAE